MWQFWWNWKRRIVWPLALLAAPGCRLFLLPQSPPTLYRTERLPLVVSSDFHLPANSPLLEELVALRDSMAFTLDLPPSPTLVHVDVFETPAAYRAYMAEHFPDFPDRRAFFVECEGRLAVYAFWGERVAEDLRHEVTHAYLHAVTPTIPLWLDEGLAEYFEVPPRDRGLNWPHLAQLTAAIDCGQWWPDVGRLATIESVTPMTQRDYAEAWAWAHFCLHTTADRRIRFCGYIQRLFAQRGAAPATGDSLAVDQQDAAALVDHLMALRNSAVRQVQPPAPPGDQPARRQRLNTPVRSP